MSGSVARLKWRRTVTDNVGPFWFPDMFANLGFRGSAGLMVGIIIVFSILPTVFVQLRGRGIGEKRSKNELDQVNTITR